jgi:hypothetical protein
MTDVTASLTLRLKWYVRPLLYTAVAFAVASEWLQAKARAGMVCDSVRK